ncbi:MAG: ATP-binding protein [Terrisporobacter othiniensis]|uniref:ATP-binding protein n=2 Tax=Terrisporobacter TaxID=1505652 RepID=A0AAX2ZJP6_9FIRM|nr:MULTISPECIES: ATP-binding protein [Terrisporobacter]MBN9648748.1 ATP-binding protein [Terrisporobacter glycolicus]MDU4862578.1 ATP-binding protein [Terrisporobacter othiniensis]MDU6996513.1 ATP-binding protein [Terrisporobacter othiniensis]UEL49569.1 ATP-binding protein [Terrisporobacter hibernicus]HBI92995.1 histidine kinase [Terrisporobacter hibernicus]
MTCEIIKMEITANPEYVSIIRLTTSGIANKVGFCIDDIEDLKVAISEACTNAIKHSLDDRFTIIYSMIENGLTIEIIDNGKGYDISTVNEPDIDNLKESGMGLFIIESLMDDVIVESQEGKGTSIKMTKYLGVDM